jgi:hypothetical protein
MEHLIACKQDQDETSDSLRAGSGWNILRLASKIRMEHLIACEQDQDGISDGLRAGTGWNI